MKMKTESYDVGVIVGRFQVPYLHEAHIDLIQGVCDAHPRVILFLGVSECRGTKNNPMDFEMRKQMILEAFPKVNVLYIHDMQSDHEWSKKLDEQIKHFVSPTNTVVLYGGRDSFLSCYDGKYPSLELVQDRWVSGTEMRERISKEVRSSMEFRAGVIHCTGNLYPATLTTVDIAIYNEEEDKMLLGRKKYEDKYRFCGGFSEPDSVSFESDARREVHEEMGIDITDPVYIGSTLIDDWRYRGEVNQIKTLLFEAKYRSGRVTAGDDIYEARWFPIKEVKENLMPQHVQLFDLSQGHIKLPTVLMNVKEKGLW